MSDELAAGRELDRRVAEQIMGWVWGEQIHPLTDQVRQRWIVPPRALDKGGMRRPDYQVAGLETPNAPNWDCMLPAYSSDIAAAWLVVEQVGARLDCSLSQMPMHEGRKLWGCMFGTSGGALEETAPLAICRAALAAAAPDAGRDGEA